MSEPCPCGSEDELDRCCGRFLPSRGGTSLPETPEQLMRSRYTAFAVRDADYLLASWHPDTRPGTVNLDPSITWTGLEIVSADGTSSYASEGTVEFRAQFWHKAIRRSGVQRERSTFHREDGRWYYVGGRIQSEADPSRSGA